MVNKASAPKRPYLLRAFHEWISDGGFTPHLVVDAAVAGVEVPGQYVQEGRITLNVSYAATRALVLGNDEVAFEGRFGGTPMGVRVPLRAVLGIYARETGEGLMFPPDEYEGPTDRPDPGPAGPEPPPAGGRPTLKVVK